MTTQKTLEAAERYGLNLEFKTKKILSDLNFTYSFNQSFPIQDQIIDIDLIAKNNVEQHIIIECKGSLSNLSLMFIKEPQGKTNDPYILIEPSLKTHQIANPNNNYVTFTGDFLNEKFSRIAKDNSRNHYYKAQE